MEIKLLVSSNEEGLLAPSGNPSAAGDQNVKIGTSTQMPSAPVGIDINASVSPEARFETARVLYTQGKGDVAGALLDSISLEEVEKLIGFLAVDCSLKNEESLECWGAENQPNKPGQPVHLYLSEYSDIDAVCVALGACSNPVFSFGFNGFCIKTMQLGQDAFPAYHVFGMMDALGSKWDNIRHLDFSAHSIAGYPFLKAPRHARKLTLNLKGCTKEQLLAFIEPVKDKKNLIIDPKGWYELGAGDRAIAEALIQSVLDQVGQ